jgi:hypothetical protein
VMRARATDERAVDIEKEKAGGQGTSGAFAFEEVDPAVVSFGDLEQA